MSAFVGREKWSGGALERVPFCPMCQSNERILVGATSDSMISRPDTWSLWLCSVCKSEWIDPRPDERSLGAAYDFEYITHQVPGQIPRGTILGSLINGYLWSRFSIDVLPRSRWGRVVFQMMPPLRMKLDYYGRHLKVGKGERLLDIGCGNGDFVALASSMGWKAEGLDPDPAAVAACIGRGVEVTQGFVKDLPLAKKECFWHAVTMSHCVEHVSDPRLLMRAVHHMLVPGGKMWIAVPNPQSLGAQVYGLNWESIDSPRHLVLPTREALVKACLDVGFDAVHSVRRGAHTSRLYARSAAISRERGRRGFRYSRAFARLLSIAADVLATISLRRSDEIVIVAEKRGRE